MEVLSRHAAEIVLRAPEVLYVSVIVGHGLPTKIPSL